MDNEDFLQALIPFDSLMLHRMQSTEEFIKVILGRSNSNKPSPNQMILRLHKALHAVDAFAANANHREIAELFYGQQRIREEYWKTSPIRQSIIRLCRLGQKMMDGGYVELLHL